MIRSVQTKIILLLVLVTIIMVAGIYFLNYIERQEINLLITQKEIECSKLLEKIIESNSRTLRNMSEDYTYWDEMVNFVKTRDKTWAYQNIYTPLQTFRANAAWVFDKNLELIYSSNNIQEGTLKDFPLSKDDLTNLVSTGNLYNFFVNTKVGLLEMSGATIHPTADPQRLTPVQGYFFIARLWSDKYLEELSLLTDGKIQFYNLEAKNLQNSNKSKQKFETFIVKNLLGWDGKPVQDICYTEEVVMANLFYANNKIKFLYTISIGLLIILIMGYMFHIMVNKPLNLISKSLTFQDPIFIQKLIIKKNEFGKLANLIVEFFVQKSKLIKEINERKIVEDILRESETKLRQIVEHSTNLFYARTTDHVLTYVSPQSRTFLDCEPEDALQKWTNFITNNPINTEGIKRIQLAIDNCSKQPPYELELKTKTGRIVWVEVNESPVIENGKTIAIVGSLTDITEKKRNEAIIKRIEEQVRHAQKMESIGTLAGGIAHDFNNILAIIMGHSSLCELRKNDPEKIEQSIYSIKKAANRGAELVNQILTFARQNVLKLEPVQINDVITEFLKLSKETFPKNIEFVLLLDKNVPQILIDQTQLHQILLNISVNSRDAMPEGGTIRFITKVVSRNELKNKFQNLIDDKYICLSIADTGVGMSEEIKARIFDPFFTTKEFGKGTGLGLSTVYGIMQSHRGLINVISAPGNGTTFELFFPIIEESYLSREYESPEPPQKLSGNETILLIEDEEMLLSALKDFLSSNNYKVLTAADGLEGLNIYNTHKDNIDLLIIDIGLPRLSGIEIYKKIKSTNGKVKAILSSGQIEPDTIFEIFRLGANDFIQKPYDMNIILKKIRATLDIKT